MRLLFTIAAIILTLPLWGQQRLSILDRLSYEPVAGATLTFPESGKSLVASESGQIQLTTAYDSIPVILSAAGYRSDTILLDSKVSTFTLVRSAGAMQEVVVTGTLRTVLKSASPVAVEVYTPKFFLKNPSPALFDALQMINGVRPQLNCNVCNTGDIHINGLEGPYTMVLIDGMPIVSSLASVYGLSGIPNSLVERIEVVKGPASSLYGSEAMGGLINVITKNPSKAPKYFMDISSTSWWEKNIDLGISYKLSGKMHALTGVNYFDYSNPLDRNGDNFTDITLQKRLSVFNKIDFKRKENRVAGLALRYIYEDRWGGEMQWNKQFRGTDSVYGESIYTSRAEIIGNYQLPVKPRLLFSYSLNDHIQRSAYGTTIFNAEQRVAFGQLTWQESLNGHELLLGAVSRYTWYDDNTPATQNSLTGENMADKILLPGIFLQDEFKAGERQDILLGVRYDYDERHGNIITPRLAYKYNMESGDIFRLNAGSGFRVVNLFTEDHAALTGAREVVIEGSLKPERSLNVNLNYIKRFQGASHWINLDGSAWYTYFSNRIIPDYLTDPDKIIYANLDGHSVSSGTSLNIEMGFKNSLRFNGGFSWMNVQTVTTDATGKKQKERQLLTERWSGTWALSYMFRKSGWSVDYTGNVYGPMLLPLISDTDPRSPESPVWSIQNIQLTKKISGSVEAYGGIKNLLNWTPAKTTPFLIARAHDPFDKQVEFDSNGKAIATPSNPHALTFDPNYVYAPNQGLRVFAGIRWSFKD